MRFTGLIITVCYLLTVVFAFTGSALSQTAPYKSAEVIDPVSKKYVSIFRRYDQQYDGHLILDLVNPSNENEIFTFDFPTKANSVSYYDKSLKHTGLNTLDGEINSIAIEDFSPQSVLKARLHKKLDTHLFLFELFDLEDELVWGQIFEKYPDADDSILMPPKTITVLLSQQKYTRQLRQKKLRTVTDIVERNKAEDWLISLFPERSKQKFDEAKGKVSKFVEDDLNETYRELGKKVPTKLKNLKLTTTGGIPFGQNSSCVFNYAVSKPKSLLKFQLVLVTVVGECVIEGIEFTFIRTVPNDVNDETINPAQLIVDSSNLIEDLISETKVSKRLVADFGVSNSNLAMTLSEVKRHFSNKREAWRKFVLKYRKDGKTLRGYEIDQLASEGNKVEYVTYAVAMKPFEQFEAGPFTFRPHFENDGTPNKIEYSWYFSEPISEWKGSSFMDICTKELRRLSDALLDTEFQVFDRCTYVGITPNFEIMTEMGLTIYKKS